MSSGDMHEEGAAAEAPEIASDVDEPESAYKVPEKTSAQEMLNKDKDDEALEKYKNELLGNDTSHITGQPTKVTLTKMTLISITDGVVKEIDLTNILTEKLPQIKIKEGIKYQIEFQFLVENDIVTGLKYHHVVKTKGIKVDKESHMLGSFAPNSSKTIIHKIPENEMPSGMLARGNYSVHSQFIDDDKNEYLKWDWSFSLSKDW